MSKILACIDGSAWADSVIELTAWAHERTGVPISLLHVVAPHSEVEAKTNLSGQIGLGAKSSLLKELAQLDEEHGKLELKKGQLMLTHARELLQEMNSTASEILHRRGSLVETVDEFQDQADMIIMGKRGEHHQDAPDHMGSNLERVARTIHKPLLVAVPHPAPVRKYLIAYDGSESADKAIDFATTNPLLKGLEGHILKVGSDTPENNQILERASARMKEAGHSVEAKLITGKPVESVVGDYVAGHGIDLLVIGAYGHSRIRSLILGSTTSALIRGSKIPVMLFR